MNIKITSAEIDSKIARFKADISRIRNRLTVLEPDSSTRESQAVPAGAVKSDSVGAKKIAKLTGELNQKIQSLKELDEALRALLVAHLKLINGKAKTYTMDADEVIDYAFEKEKHLVRALPLTSKYAVWPTGEGWFTLSAVSAMSTKLPLRKSSYRPRQTIISSKKPQKISPFGPPNGRKNGTAKDYRCAHCLPAGTYLSKQHCLKALR